MKPGLDILKTLEDKAVWDIHHGHIIIMKNEEERAKYRNLVVELRKSCSTWWAVQTTDGARMDFRTIPFGEEDGRILDFKGKIVFKTSKWSEKLVPGSAGALILEF